MQVLLQPHEEMGIICVQEILERDLEDRGITYALLMWFPWLVAWWGPHGKRWQGHASAKDLSWQSHARSLGLQTRQVTHQNREFTRELADPVPRKSALAGTQKLDRDWLRLKCFLGHYPLKSNHKTQPKLELLLFQFVWRIHNAWNLAGMDFLSMLTDLL